MLNALTSAIAEVGSIRLSGRMRIETSVIIPRAPSRRCSIRLSGRMRIETMSGEERARWLAVVASGFRVG